MIVFFLVFLLATDPPLMGAMEPAAATTIDPATMPAIEPATRTTTAPATTSLATTAPTTAESRRTFDSSTSDQRRYSRFRSERNSSRNPSQTNPPSISPATIDPLNPRPMSPEFAVLLSRSMFVRGHISVDTHRSGGGVPLQNTSPPPSTEPSLARPEAALVFNGVTVANGNPVAFIEDTANQRVLTVQVGQQIAQGQITDITLDTLAYRNSSRTVVLHIGQDLSGNDAATAMPTTAPGDLPSTGDSVLDRLRKKRLQELLGK